MVVFGYIPCWCGYSLMSSGCNESELSDSGIDDGYVIISSSFFKKKKCYTMNYVS